MILKIRRVCFVYFISLQIYNTLIIFSRFFSSRNYESNCSTRCSWWFFVSMSTAYLQLFSANPTYVFYFHFFWWYLMKYSSNNNSFNSLISSSNVLFASCFSSPIEIIFFVLFSAIKINVKMGTYFQPYMILSAYVSFSLSLFYISINTRNKLRYSPS